MAAVSKYISYGPVRRSGTPLVGTHVETGVQMAPHMPTTPANLTRALHHDWRWWSDRGDEMTERFAAWLRADRRAGAWRRACPDGASPLSARRAGSTTGCEASRGYGAPRSG